ncbi:MAG: hypothetical protein JW778_06885 [Candidatus Altiarchaeota archaeon]|nr:hypothetical protein [Candidatus Altiarchaeota archaeon]
MKDPIILRLTEVKRLAFKINLLGTILNSLIVFLVFAVILRLFGIAAIIAACPAIIYAIIGLMYRLHKLNLINSVIKSYPALDERLQTAYDNRRTHNVIVDSLIKEVSKKMDDVRYSSFLNTNELMSRAIIAIVLVFVFLSINFINIEDLGFNLRGFIDKDLIDRIEDFTGFDIQPDDSFHASEDERFETKHKVEDEMVGGDIGGELPGVNEGPIPGFGGGTGEEGGSDIYGEESSAKIAGKNMDMEMHPEYGGEIEIKDVGEERLKGEFAGDLKGKSAEIPEQDPVEYRELIKAYFQSLQKITQE